MSIKSDDFKKKINRGHEKLLGMAGQKIKDNARPLVRGVADTVKTAARTAAPLANIGTGVAGGVVGMMSWMATRGLLDNKIIDALEQRMKKKNKSSPYRSALVRYYAMLMMAVGASVGGYQMINNNANAGMDDLATDPIASEVVFDRLQQKEFKISPTNDYHEFVAQCRPLTPFLVSFLSCPEGFRDAVYRDGRGVPTIGYGSTITPNGTVSMKMSPITKGQAYEYARWHIEDYETSFIIYCYCVAFNKELSANEYLGLASFLYNGGAKMFEPDADKKANRVRNDRWTLMTNIFRENGTITRDQVLEHFEKYPIMSEGSVCAAWRNGDSLDTVGDNMTNYLSGGRGLHWRRWIEACILTGRVSPLDLLDCPVGGIYEFQQYMKHVKGIGLIDRDARSVNYDAADEFQDWLHNMQYWDSRRKCLYTPPAGLQTIRSILPQEIVAMCENTDINQMMDGVKVAAFDAGTGEIMKRMSRDEIKTKNLINDALVL